MVDNLTSVSTLNPLVVEANHLCVFIYVERRIVIIFMP